MERQQHHHIEEAGAVPERVRDRVEPDDMGEE
jgi:hypothetical protein